MPKIYQQQKLIIVGSQASAVSTLLQQLRGDHYLSIDEQGRHFQEVAVWLQLPERYRASSSTEEWIVQLNFVHIRPEYLRAHFDFFNSNQADYIFVIDVTSADSFRETFSIMDFIKPRIKLGTRCTLLLNNAHLPRAQWVWSQEEENRFLVECRDIPLYHVDSTNRDNIVGIFSDIAETAYQYQYFNRVLLIPGGEKSGVTSLVNKLVYDDRDFPSSELEPRDRWKRTARYESKTMRIHERPGVARTLVGENVRLSFYVLGPEPWPLNDWTSYARNQKFLLFVIDVAQEAHFMNMEQKLNWCLSSRSRQDGTLNCWRNPEIFCLLNKADLPKEQWARTSEQLRELSRKFSSVKFIEISSQTGMQVDKVLEQLLPLVAQECAEDPQLSVRSKSEASSTTSTVLATDSSSATTTTTSRIRAAVATLPTEEQLGNQKDILKFWIKKALTTYEEYLNKQDGEKKRQSIARLTGKIFHNAAQGRTQAQKIVAEILGAASLEQQLKTLEHHLLRTDNGSYNKHSFKPTLMKSIAEGFGFKKMSTYSEVSDFIGKLRETVGLDKAIATRSYYRPPPG